MITETAFAKINLGLRILNKREDGYHNLETIFHRVDISDTLRFEHSDSISFRSNEGTLKPDTSNLCIKAAVLLKERFQVSKGVSISLEKRIPIGAGLGGGSSDAAVTLLGLNKLWELSLSQEELAQFALSLGSDVPYFLRPGSAFAGGRGELLEYVNILLPFWIVVVFPNVHISTPWAFNQLKRGNEHRDTSMQATFLSAQEKRELLASLERGNAEQLNRTLRNDFEEAVFREYPALERVKMELIRSGSVFSQMSGSGSSVYGLFSEANSAKGAVELLGASCRTFLTQPNFAPGN